MQYQIEDILQEKDYQPKYLMTALLDACQDELEMLVADQALRPEAIDTLRERIDEVFGPREAIPETFQPGPYVRSVVNQLRPLFKHRRCRVTTRASDTAPIRIPPEVLGKVVEGLVRNAVENTPDGGRVNIYVRTGKNGPEVVVKDNGIGISKENQRLIFDNYFTAYETMQYSTRQPYDFRAGGKGFDLLRMKIFSERYGGG